MCKRILSDLYCFTSSFACPHTLIAMSVVTFLKWYYYSTLALQKLFFVGSSSFKKRGSLIHSYCFSAYLKRLPCTYLCLALCRKPEALWEAALASCVVPEGGGSLPALSEGAWARGGDLTQATHQTRLVFLETPILLSTCLLKGVLHWLFHPKLGHHTQETQLPCNTYRGDWLWTQWRNDPQCYYAWMSACVG